jgi:aspartyl-tRNA(Asn)/glutamyl-tRNA(Gln) amidotransferase subunit C
MDVTREDVLRCARLTHLQLEESEIEPMREAMSRLLSQAERLNELPLEGIEPTTHGLQSPLSRRPDVVAPSLTQEQALANAARTSHGHFEVPKVL